MRRLRLDRVDAESARRLERALDSANAYWAATGSDDRVRAEGPDLVLGHGGRECRLTLHVEGLLLRLSRVLHDTTAMAFRSRVRFADRAGVARDASLAPDARNALFVLKSGARRDAASMTMLLVHELAHVRQAMDLPLGSIGFAAAYTLSAGRPFEREAYREGEGARRFCDRRPTTDDRR